MVIYIYDYMHNKRNILKKTKRQVIWDGVSRTEYNQQSFFIHLGVLLIMSTNLIIFSSTPPTGSHYGKTYLWCASKSLSCVLFQAQGKRYLHHAYSNKAHGKKKAHDKENLCRASPKNARQRGSHVPGMCVTCEGRQLTVDHASLTCPGLCCASSTKTHDKGPSLSFIPRRPTAKIQLDRAFQQRGAQQSF
jgi:hypothetical protein